MNQNSFFEKTNPKKLFLMVAIPGGISMLASSLYVLLDGIFVGQLLGETSFAALNLAFPFVILNFSLADLIGVGSAVPISIRLGQKEPDKANNIFTCACIMIVLTGILMGTLLYITAPFLIQLLGATGQLADFSVQYLRVYALCSPVTTIVFAMDNYLRICGKVKSSMYLNILMSIISALLEFLFLGVFHWGIWAAAFATCCGMFLCAGIACLSFTRGNMQLHYCKPVFTVSLIKQIIACGSPNFLSNIAGRITSIIMNIVLLRFGGEVGISIFGILMYASDIIQSFLYGVCDSLQPAVGYNWGAGKKERVKAIEQCCYVTSALISVISAGLLFFFPKEIISLFVAHTDSTFMETAIFAMRLFSLTYVTRWFSFATQSFMTAVEKPLYASILSIAIAFVFPLFIIVMLLPLELTGIWLNFPLTYLFAGILSLILLYNFKTVWKKTENSK